MNNHMSLKLVGANSSLELNSPITSIYLQEELTGLTTLPGIRETKGMNIGMNGGWTSAQFYEPRLITIKGVIANQDVAVVEQRRKQLIQLLAEKRLALEFQTEAGSHYTMNVVVAGVQMPLSKVLTATFFQLSLRADDPLIYDNNALGELEAILRRSSSASSGFTINFPINFQLGVSESRPTIDNFGSSVVYPVITLTGPLTTPEVVNITNNMAFTIDEVLGAGTYTVSGIRGVMTQEGTVETASGSSFQITGIEGAPLTLAEITGNAEQTTYSGKNLIDFDTATLYTNASVDSTRQGNGFKSTIKSATLPTYYDLNVAMPAGTYTLSFEARCQNSNSLLLNTQGYILGGRGDLKDANGATASESYRTLNSTWKKFSFTITTTASIAFTTPNALHLYFLAPDSSQVFELRNPMFEAGSSATEYEPYVGGTASPNPDYPQAVNTTTGENVVKITGKNIFDKDSVSPINAYIATNGSVGYSGPDRLVSVPVMPNTTYTITAQRVGQISGQYLDDFAGALFTSDTAPVVGSVGRRVFWGAEATNPTLNQTFTTSATENWLAIKAANIQRSDYAGTLATIQLEINDQATPFEPYQGQEYPIDLSSKNLFDKNAVSTGKILERTDGTLTNNASYDTSDFMPVKAGEKYTYTGFNVWYASYYDANKAFVSTPNNSTTITIPTGVAYVRCSLSHTNLDTAQFEHGAQATSYAEFYNYELAKIGTYQDRIYKTDGKWYIEKQVGKVVYNGSETGWGLQNGCFRNVIADAKRGELYEEILVISDYFIGRTTCYRGELKNGQCAKIYNSDQVGFSYTSLLDATAWTTWLASHPLSVYYVLATPTTTEITDSTLLSQLNFIANLYGGTNNIMLVGTGAQGEIEARTGQIIEVIDSLSIAGASGSIEIDLNDSELAAVGSVNDELTINGATGAVTKTARVGKIASYAGESITTDYISTTGGLDTGATVYYVLPSSSTSTLSTLDSTALATFNGIVASGGVSAQTNIGSISVDATTLAAQDVAVVDTKQHTVTINGVGAYSKFSGDWLTLDVGLNELQLITENNTDTGSAVIKYRVGYMGV